MNNFKLILYSEVELDVLGKMTEAVDYLLQNYNLSNVTILTTTPCQFVDTYAMKCKELKYATIDKKYGKPAAMYATIDLIKEADAAVVMYDTYKPATDLFIRLCKQHNLPIRIYNTLK